jgi:hypothetical protein
MHEGQDHIMMILATLAIFASLSRTDHTPTPTHNKKIIFAQFVTSRPKKVVF